MKYRIRSEYYASFESPVREHHVRLRLAPAEDGDQSVLACTFESAEALQPIHHRDGYGNPVYAVARMAPHDTLSVTMRAEVVTRLENPFDYQPVRPDRERDWIAHGLHEAPRLWDFVLHRSALTPDGAQFTQALAIGGWTPGRPLIGQVQEVMEKLALCIDFDPARTTLQPRLQTLLENRCASSGDLAHLLVSVVRSWGVPARYAVGYVDPDFFAPEEDEEDAEPLPQSLRAWADVLIPGAGWRGFDPAEGLVVNDTYVRVAVGRDAADVLATRCTFKGASQAPEQGTLVEVWPSG